MFADLEGGETLDVGNSRLSSPPTTNVLAPISSLTNTGCRDLEIMNENGVLRSRGVATQTVADSEFHKMS